MTRLAFVSPLPPATTGIADYSLEVAALLAETGRLRLELFHGGESVAAASLPPDCATHPASTFLDRHAAEPYDLALYQLGNGLAHAFQYDLLARVPGLLVLHDLVLHHSRARMFLESEEALAYAREPWSATRRDAARILVARYRAEVEYCHPGRGDALVDCQLGTYGYPAALLLSSSGSRSRPPA